MSPQATAGAEMGAGAGAVPGGAALGTSDVDLEALDG